MDDLVTVEVFQYVAEADLLKAMVEGEGIVAYLADDNVFSYDASVSR